MKTIELSATIAALFLVSATAAAGQTFTIGYTTQAGSVEGPATSVTLTAVTTPDPYTAGAYRIMSLTGTRGSGVVDGFDEFSAFYFPPMTRGGSGYSTYFDNEGGAANLTYFIGTSAFTIVRNNASFYNEFQDDIELGTVSRTVLPGDLTVTRAGIAAAAPEPATWALMVAGFGLAGAALRRRRTPAPITAAA